MRKIIGEIIQVKTLDNLDLYGIILEPKKKKSIIINIHGTADNFYDNEFIWQIAESVSSLGVSMMSVNNRGSYNLEFYDYGKDVRRNSGASVEIFEKCILDIDAWINLALSLGYKNIILQGHSLGSEKVVYYMSKGKYKEVISAVILLGFSDSLGTHLKFLKKCKIDLMKEAKSLIKAKKKNQFLVQYWLSHAGILPQSAESYFNFFKENSELSKALPLRQGENLKMYQNIKTPILGVIGDQEEYTVISKNRAINLLRKENKLAEIYQLKNCDHCFAGNEKKLSFLISSFLKAKIKQ